MVLLIVLINIVKLLSIVEATLETRCGDAKLNCDHGCRWEHRETGDVACFCNEGFRLGQDGRACIGKLITCYHYSYIIDIIHV